MTVQTHFCPPRNRPGPGDEMDCPECRTRLLEAFREPADSDYRPANMPLEPVPWHPSQGSEMVPGERVTAGLHALGRCTGCVHREHTVLGCLHPACECEVGPPVVWSVQADYSYQVRWTVTGGRWGLRCDCGWKLDGNHLPGHEEAARDICKGWAVAHLNLEHST